TRRPGGISRIFGVSNKPSVAKPADVSDSIEEKADGVETKSSKKSVREKGKPQDVEQISAAPEERDDSADQERVVVKDDELPKSRQKKASIVSGESEQGDSGEKSETKESVSGGKTRRKKDSLADEVVSPAVGSRVKDATKVDVDEKTDDSNKGDKSAEKAPVVSPSIPGAKKTQPIAPAINRRDLKRGSGHGQTKPTVEPRPVRPLPPVYSQPDRTQILEEMTRPPVITPHAGSRVAVLGGNQKKSNAGSSASSRSNAGKGSVTIGRLAQLPDAPSRPVAKKPQEQTAQKPVRILSPDVINRARDAGVSVTDVLKTSQRTGRDASKSKTGGAKVVRGSSEIGTSPSGDFASGGSRKGRNYRDRDADGQDTRNRKNNNDSRRSRNSFQTSDDDDYGYVARSRGPRQSKKSSVAVTLARVNDIVIETPCTVRDFSEATGIGVATVIKELMKMGMMKTTNQSLDSETIQLLILSFDLKATVKEQVTLEEQFVDAAFNEVDPPESLVPRAPVVTFLGHVDHGKTSLLDRILHLHVVSGEKGGITQHIRAYRVNTEKGAVTFVDTPGHEAFTEMRARGANCTDVAVLVVAADDGVMPQTEEAISHAKAAGVPIIVALNKMDLPGVKRDKVIQELANNDLTPSEWGGDVEIVETSAITGMGIDNLLDTILTVAELSELKANPNRAANGVVLEASLQSGEGVVCKALVQNGTLRNGDVVLCGASYGRVRSMTDTLDSHKRIKEAGPSVPVSLTGLDVAPEAGSKFVVLEDVSVARQIAEERAKRAREIELAGAPSHITLENLFERMNSAKSQ
ncbi:MAG: translation initiation factor IF-2, partial [Thermoguttaceae bacterium]|nr:translation initiation factor IF-2 [Thermoguttaceae bacterium]